MINISSCNCVLQENIGSGSSLDQKKGEGDLGSLEVGKGESTLATGVSMIMLVVCFLGIL